MESALIISAGIHSLESLAPAIGRLDAMEAERRVATAAAERGYFKPTEEEILRAWFARYLTARAGLLETIDDLSPLARASGADDETRLRCFVIAYASACLLMRGARTLVGEVATHKVVQRKLNEASPAHCIPRKQYTRVYRSMTSLRSAWQISEAIDEADRSRPAFETLRRDPAMTPVFAVLDDAEDAVLVGMRDYLKARLRYRWHSWRRRRASAAQQGFFGVLEGFGRVIAEVRAPRHRDRVTSAVRDEVATLLHPGDVIVTRHDNALSNLFLPGYWPHAALHVGPASEHYRVLEARKDGVRRRAIDDTFAVDAFTIVRPRLGEAEISAAMAAALSHEGKPYNFDFDFFNDDRLVCTEVVYRAYEGVGGIEFRLQSRAGRVTLSAEDLLDLAVEDRGFEPVAVFGTPGVGNRLVTGADAASALAESYRIR